MHTHSVGETGPQAHAGCSPGLGDHDSCLDRESRGTGPLHLDPGVELGVSRD